VGVGPMRPSRGFRSGMSRRPPSRGTPGPLVGLRGAPRTHDHGDRRRTLVPPDPCGVWTPIGCCLRGLPDDRSRPRALPALPCPFRGIHRSPARSRRPVGRHGGPCFLSWAFPPYDAISVRRPGFDRGTTRDPRPRAGFGYPLRGPSATVPTGAHGAGASLGFTLQGVLLVPSRPPSRGPGPPGVAGTRAAPEDAREHSTDFRASIPTRMRSVADPTRGPAAAAFLGFIPPERSPHPSGSRALVARPPLPPRLRVDVPTRGGHRVLRSGWSGLVRLRTAGSPGILHLPTVAALRSPLPGAGVWLCLAPGAQLALPSRRS
jgi:hypothetical protein